MTKVLILVFIASITLSFSPHTIAVNAENSAELMQQWITLETQKGKLQTDWSQRQQQLQQRLSLFKLEQEALQQVIKKSSEVTSDVDEQRLALLSKQNELEAEQQQVAAQLHTMADTIEQFSLHLPPPLQQQWQQKLALIKDTNVSSSERLERLLSLFKLADDFDKRIAIHRTSMAVNDNSSDDQQVMVTQIYLGLSQGWYINDSDNIYGYGRADKMGWKWYHQQDADAELGTPLSAAAIVKLRNTLEEPTTASYLALPVKTQGL
ncbi:DUF3450 family protein [Alteromonadaceae bacterium BrNp21-10]|nr:DUF3450 family protein [Alteromonadaceae bacterium BrNp21-10]